MLIQLFVPLTILLFIFFSSSIITTIQRGLALREFIKQLEGYYPEKYEQYFEKKHSLVHVYPKNEVILWKFINSTELDDDLVIKAQKNKCRIANKRFNISLKGLTITIFFLFLLNQTV
jgi:hypothetical protein